MAGDQFPLAKMNGGCNTKTGRRGFTARCALLVKQHRARLYILRRCATMLLCSYIHGDD